MIACSRMHMSMCAHKLRERTRARKRAVHLHTHTHTHTCTHTLAHTHTHTHTHTQGRSDRQTDQCINKCHQLVDSQLVVLADTHAGVSVRRRSLGDDVPVCARPCDFRESTSRRVSSRRVSTSRRVSSSPLPPSPTLCLRSVSASA